jgi:methyl-accepting chemotaxis protein
MIESEDNVTFYYLCAFFVVQVFSLLLLGTILTHKIAGPAFRIIRTMEDIASGKLKKIGHLRRFDELQNFVEPVNNLIESINKRLALDIENLEGVKTKISSSIGEPALQRDLIAQIDQLLKEKKEMIMPLETCNGTQFNEIC